MLRWSRTFVVLTTMVAVALPGCSTSRPRFSEYTEAEDPTDRSLYDTTNLYPEMPTDVEYDPFAAAATAPPITIHEEEPREYWDLSLQEAIRLALINSKIMRDLGGTILRAPTSMRAIQDPAITETDARFGVEAALSHFDTHFATSGYFEKNDRALNNVFFGGGTRLLQQDGNVYQTQLSKRTATGAELSLRNNTDYDSNNAPGNAFFSSWNTNIEAQVRQPLLAFGGVEYNRIYGPNGIPGLPAGVLLARTNTDQSLADFEIGIRNFASDVENAYWDLYFAYRELDARIMARNAALETWRRVNALNVAGRAGGEAQQEAQAREQYYRFQEEVQNALIGRLTEGTRSNIGSSGGTFRGTGGIHVAERRLRLLIGTPINDSRLIRPADEPTLANTIFEWDVILAESLSRRPELRKQKWLVKRRELEVLGTKNLLLPRLDATGRYRWRGFGKDLIAYSDPRDLGQFNSAWGNLLTGNFQEWQLGFEFEVPLGFRHAHNAVRNYELQLARERAILSEQERYVVLDLSNAIGDLNRAYAVLQTNQNRRVSAKQQLAAIKALNDPSPQTLFLVLESQRRLVEAEIQYYRSLVEYELAIKNVHFEKGSILEYNGVVLSELPWPHKAYQDAFEKIRLRTKAPRAVERVVDESLILSDGPAPQQLLPANGVSGISEVITAPQPPTGVVPPAPTERRNPETIKTPHAGANRPALRDATAPEPTTRLTSHVGPAADGADEEIPELESEQFDSGPLESEHEQLALPDEPSAGDDGESDAADEE
ncbi:MAG: TolC family protein [Planctomycetaceae bacterium]